MSYEKQIPSVRMEWRCRDSGTQNVEVQGTWGRIGTILENAPG